MAGMVSHVILMSFAGEKISKQSVAGRHGAEQAPAPQGHRKDGTSVSGLRLYQMEAAACLKRHHRGPEPRSVTFQLGDLSE